MRTLSETSKTKKILRNNFITNCTFFDMYQLHMLNYSHPYPGFKTKDAILIKIDW